ncbi:unnamed protein product [Arctia plantaginis]|uniref:Uncharacterized protein n=1 Tax=Arctia plantaginis TaxID=874455 RepID=A0A8S1AEK0_ARCPL|nr:unnamed protein product [Arctia plantaginis]CAB3253837.1 unnamed protein product [Arctia plantaginis]
MRGTEQNLLIFISLTSTLAAAGPAPIEDEDDNLLLPGSSCEESPPCPDGKICEMIEPPCYTRVCDSDLVPACVYTVFGPKPVSDEEVYIRLPGQSCDDAPPCPDDRTCIMEAPKCYSRRCGFTINIDPKMFKWIIIGLLVVLTAADDDTEYIHLPGKTCEDAPPCPDGTPCVMAPPMCNKGTCGTDPVPSCRA